MLTYEYLCEKCKASFEAQQRISDSPLESCPKEGCDGKVRRQIGVCSFHLKGSGWFKDGY